MVDITHINAPEVPTNPAFSHAVAVTGPARTVYIGGQNGAGDDLYEQTKQALGNLKAVLAASDATPADVVSMTITLVDGTELTDGFRAFTEEWPGGGKPPIVSVATVVRLANPAFLVEIGAIAVTS